MKKKKNYSYFRNLEKKWNKWKKKKKFRKSTLEMFGVQCSQWMRSEIKGQMHLVRQTLIASVAGTRRLNSWSVVAQGWIDFTLNRFRSEASLLFESQVDNHATSTFISFFSPPNLYSPSIFWSNQCIFYNFRLLLLFFWS